MSQVYYGQILSFTACNGSPTLLIGRGLSRPSMCRSSRVPCSTPTETEFRQHLPAVLQNTRLELVKPRGCASEEQQGGAAEIRSQDGVKHETRPDLHILRLSNMDNPEEVRL